MGFPYSNNIPTQFYARVFYKRQLSNNFLHFKLMLLTKRIWQGNSIISAISFPLVVEYSIRIDVSDIDADTEDDELRQPQSDVFLRIFGNRGDTGSRHLVKRGDRKNRFMSNQVRDHTAIHFVSC